MKKFSLEIDHLMVPVGILSLCLIYLFRGNSIIQFQLVVISTLFYLSAALLHHHFDKSLTFEIIAEYILIAALVLIILQGFLI